MKCLAPPLGCGREISEAEVVAWDSLTLREFQISGWCSTCQEDVFAEEDEDEWDEEVPCNCLGLSHQNDCPNWVLPY